MKRLIGKLPFTVILPTDEHMFQFRHTPSPTDDPPPVGMRRGVTPTGGWG